MTVTTVTSYTTLVGGGELSYDSHARASYLCVNHTEPICANAVARTIDLGGGLLVDVDTNGTIIGVENHQGELVMADLVRVLAWCAITETTTDPA
jgi:uncharacterized protein YuzE